MKLSVVIVNYNTRDLLHDCLQSLVTSTLQAEVIVVDNASSDGSAAMVEQHFPAVKLLAQQTNTWFTGGNNIGIQAAVGKYVLLLNPDTVVQPSSLEILVSFMDSNPDYAGVTAQLHYPDGIAQQTCSRIPTYEYLLLAHTPLGWLRPKRKTAVLNHHWYTDEGFQRKRSRDVQVLPGSCTMMRRKDISLNENLRLYFPEDDLAQRHKNRKFRFLAETSIKHVEKSSTRSWLATHIYFQDMMIYTQIHHGWWHMIWLHLLTRPLWLALWFKAKIS